MGLRHSNTARSAVIHEATVKSLSDDNLTWYNRPVKAFQVTISDTNKQVSAEALTSPSISAHAWSTTRDVISRLRRPDEASVINETIAEVGSLQGNKQTKRTRSEKERESVVVENVLEQVLEFLVYEIEPVLIAEYCRHNNNNNYNNTGATEANQTALFTDRQQLRDLLTNIVGNFKSEEFVTFCHLLRKVDSERRTADLLEALDVIVKVLSPCCCEYCGLRGSTGQQTVNVVYTDSETKAALPFNYVERLKRCRRRKSRLILDGQRPAVVLRDTADRYVPMLSMKLEGQSLCERQIRQVERLLEQFMCVRELTITKTILDTPSVLRIGRVLQLNTQLYSLNLHNTQLGNDGILFLTYSLRHNSSLRLLKLSENQLTYRSCLLLSRCLVGHNITDLDLSDNKISDKGCVLLSRLVSSRNCKLRVLSVSNNNIGCEGAADLFNSLRRNARLSYIDLSDNSLGDNVLTILSEILIVNRTLRQLLLMNCQLSDTSCISISRSLKTNTSLKTLQLDRNIDITDTGLESLAESLKYNKSLEHLGLSHCTIGNTGCCYIIDALHYNMTVNTVDLRCHQTALVKLVGTIHQHNIERADSGSENTPVTNNTTFYYQNHQHRILMD